MNALLKVRGTAWAAAVALVLVPLAGVAPAAAEDVPPAIEAGVIVAGTPTITGTVRVGEELTAEPGDWTPDVPLTFQWLRDGVAIPEATGKIYTVTPDDAAKSLAVTVTGTLDGAEPASATSQPTPPVELGLFQTSLPTIDPTAHVGTTLTAVTAPWTPTVELTHQWLRNGSPIEDANDATYVVTPGDLGTTLSVTVTGARRGYATASETSAPTSTVVEGAFTTAPDPVVTGTAKVGSTLTAVPGTWVPAATPAYQWLRNGAPIAGAQSATYVLTGADAGAEISVRVTGTATGFAAIQRTSAPTGPIAQGTFTAPVPTITGTLKVGQVLTARAGTWAPAATPSYQWLRNGVAISGQTKSTYRLVAADRGKQISVQVKGTATGYTSVTKTSAKTAAVAAGTLTAPVPVISTPRVGARTTVTLGTWTAGTTRTYQWYVAGKAVPGTRGTASFLTPTASERGKTITVKVTGALSGYTTVTKTAAAKTIGYGVFTTAPTPKITGTAKVGSTLSVSRGTWAPTPSAWAYQWRANGTAIAGATRSTYKLTSAQRGKTITVTVTAKLSGYSNKAVTSAKTATVVQAFTASPSPRITGTVQVGKTLTANTGTWSPKPTFSYQWRANGVAIKGATKASFKLTSAQAGKVITVSLTAKATNFITMTKTSAATPKVVRPFASAPVPTVRGTARAGSTLSAVVPAWSPRPSLRYQWRANGTAIAGATGSSLTLTSGQVGKAITVTVTGSASGYATTSRTSAPTSIVAPPPAPPSRVPGYGYDCPAGYPIKGNANSGIYHVPGGQYYGVTRPEECFATEAAAVAAGYRRSLR